jgi:zinc transport system substrate-binding protein
MRLCVLLLCLHSAALAAAPRVVTSIAPVFELTAAVMTGVAEPGLIIDGDASAHHFAFKPSHMRSLQQADLVIWIDRHFEAGFSRVAEILPSTTAQLELLPSLGLEGSDGHIWYSPRLLLRSIEIIRDRLLALDPEHQNLYQANADMLMQDIRAWRNETRRRWQKRQPRFVTDHNFTTYLEQDIGFSAIATVHDQHDDHGGVKDLKRLDNTLRQFPAACLLTLHATPSTLARSFARKYDLKIVSLSLERPGDPDQPLILQRLARFTTALEDCI